MKNYFLRFFYICFLIISISIFGICQTNRIEKKGEESVEIENSQKQQKKCSKNPDSLYDRTETLSKLAEILRDSIAENYRNSPYANFNVKNERGKLFFVYDLIDTSNRQIRSSECINFLNNHVYHFASFWKPFSFSHIVILEDGNLKVFKSINCKDKGETIDDVISYLNQKLKNNKNKEEIINRVKNYREYGWYGTIDDTKLRCEEISNDS